MKEKQKKNEEEEKKKKKKQKKYVISRFQWLRRVKASVCCRCLAGSAGSNPADGMDICLL